MKCTICSTVETHRKACDTCLADTRRRLREIELYAAWLHHPDLLMPTQGTGGRRSSSYASKPPLRLDVLAMTDHRSRTEPPAVDRDRGIGLDEDATWPIFDTVHVLATWIREDLGQQQPARLTLYGEIGYLLGQLDRAAGEPGIAELAAQIRGLHTRARALAHDQPPRPIGKCLLVTCEGVVYEPPPRRDTSHCTSCNRPYTGLDLVRLRTQEAR